MNVFLYPENFCFVCGNLMVKFDLHVTNKSKTAHVTNTTHSQPTVWTQTHWSFNYPYHLSRPTCDQNWIKEKFLSNSENKTERNRNAELNTWILRLLFVLCVLCVGLLSSCIGIYQTLKWVFVVLWQPFMSNNFPEKLWSLWMAF